jgi:hypothetical protein
MVLASAVLKKARRWGMEKYRRRGQRQPSRKGRGREAKLKHVVRAPGIEPGTAIQKKMAVADSPEVAARAQAARRTLGNTSFDHAWRKESHKQILVCQTTSAPQTNLLKWHNNHREILSASCCH